MGATFGGSDFTKTAKAFTHAGPFAYGPPTIRVPCIM